MNLKILLPFEIFAEKTDVSRIVAETREGSFGLLPHRLDCVAALAPGILTYETKEDGTVYLAVDEGVLVKTGADVLVSVRHAIGGTDLGQLHDAVKREFLTLDQRNGTFAMRSPKWKAALSAASRSFNMGDELKGQSAKEETEFARQVAAKAARKLRAQREGTRRLVWSRHVRTDRLVGGGADASGRDARPVVGPAPSGTPFLDTHAAGGWIGHRLCQCLALGGPGRQGMHENRRKQIGG